MKRPDVTCIQCKRVIPWVQSWKDQKAPAAFFCGAECAKGYEPTKLDRIQSWNAEALGDQQLRAENVMQSAGRNWEQFAINQAAQGMMSGQAQAAAMARASAYLGQQVEPPRKMWRCHGCQLACPAERVIETFDGKAAYCTSCASKAPAALLPEHHIARAIFETDPRVVAFVDRVGERPSSWDEAWEKRRLSVTEMAWARDEGGWRSDAEARASEIRAVLLQGPGEKP